MDTITKRKKYTRILPGSCRKTKNENKPYTKFHNHGYKAWKNKVILQLIQNNRRTNMACGNGDQTTDHLLFECDLLNKERDILKLSVVKTNVWPTSKSDLIRKYYKEFTKFINEIPFGELKVA